MVLRARRGSPVADLVTAGLPTVAIRMPAHMAMRALIAAAGRPLAAPSANASGKISATRAAHVAASLGDKVSLILDGGATRHGLESTIVAVDGERLRLLRPGPVDAAALEEASGLSVLSPAADARIEAPGQLSSHYAPGKPLRLDATERRQGEWLIGFGDVTGDDTLSACGDLIEAASRLFGALHDADDTASLAIAIAPIPREGLGLAINDRLARAAAPR
jgi:L-threonylcarbamoyladenylate synthase